MEDFFSILFLEQDILEKWKVFLEQNTEMILIIHSGKKLMLLLVLALNCMMQVGNALYIISMYFHFRFKLITAGACTFYYICMICIYLKDSILENFLPDDLEQGNIFRSITYKVFMSFMRALSLSHADLLYCSVIKH